MGKLSHAPAEGRMGQINSHMAEIVRKYRSVLAWAVNSTDYSLDLLAKIGDLSIEIIKDKSNGILILESDDIGWDGNNYKGEVLYVAAVWPPEDKARFPSWVNVENTRSSSVFRMASDVCLDSNYQEKSFFIEENKNEEKDHPRVSYYRHPPDKCHFIDDDLFLQYNCAGKNDGKYIKSAMFIPIDISSGHTSILCYYSQSATEYSKEFFDRNKEIMGLLCQSFNFARPGIGFRLISLVNQALTEAAGEDMNEASLSAALSSIPSTIAEFLHCRDVVIKFSGDRGSDVRVFATPGLEDDDFIIFLDSVLKGAKAILSVKRGEATVSSVPTCEESMSRLAVPITNDGKVVAVIACQGRVGIPYVLTAWERELLTIIGSHIARAWSEVQAKRRLMDENDAWRQAVGVIASANARGYRVLGREDIDLEKVLTQLLSVVARVIGGERNPQAGFVVRLLTDSGDGLRRCATIGAYWEKEGGKERKIQSISGAQLGLGAWAVKNRRYWHCRGVGLPDQLPDGVSGAEVGDGQMIVIPILAANSEVRQECLGVVDIHLPLDFIVPIHFRELAAVLGYQIGLFILMAKKVGKIVEDGDAAKRKFKEADEWRRLNLETMQNVHHQLDLPMVTAISQIDHLLNYFKGRPAEFDRLRTVRAFVKRSWQASSSSEILRVISSGKLSGRTFDTRPMRATDVALVLEEMAEDFRRIIDEDRKISIVVDCEDFKREDISLFKYNEKLLSQIIGNLMDNANKYSFENSRIFVSGGFTKSDNFFISIRNRGVPIPQGDGEKIKGRRYRSPDASRYAEGTGIGLWLVDQIMKHLGGRLEVIPAAHYKEYHEFRLIFMPGDGAPS